ncbi:FecR family protein [Mucilaginibacter sp. BJC16-A38]|uniref:FecR family protein n=1 Tax=Mucilaginibacter phenanthrenivorans TaxID=1234842 RepID=UPI0021583B6E|nr:FecR family protein [Mucilaginibacter phenanthrenivorans]MCR8558880.1 FecR family protein [Mucilaginibacter phenanthrenivorans]
MLRTQTMDIYKFRKRLTRYLKGESNETENAIIEAWYKSYEQEEQPLSEAEEERIRLAIHNKVKSATSKSTIIMLPIFRMAATLVFIAGIAAIIWYLRAGKNEKADYYTVQTGTNEIKQLTLSDSSIIWVNSATRIRVPVLFKGDLREIDLQEGEAFFNVKRNPQPFIVHTGGINVQVLGTSFNIQSYKKLKSIKVTVATGKVGVTKGKQTLAMLLPGEQEYYNTITGKGQQVNVNTNQAQSWKEGSTYLKEANFEELALCIKNIYGLSLKAASSRISAYRFTLQVQHNVPAREVLKVIGQLHNTHFRKEGNEVTLY